ncbi:MAG: ATP-binding protein [Bacteroidales bacterium]|nr:ATP-binding protein [Bacteroidales bacterium]
MLLEYKFENYKSFKESNSLSMIGVRSFKEHEPDNTFSFEKFKILKSAAIFGNNASGKSNLVNGLQKMKQFVKTSFRDALVEESEIQTEKFLLNSNSEKLPSRFEVTFIRKGTKYRYGFEIDSSQIVSEWLFHSTTKEVPLFERNFDKYKINKSSFKEGLNLESKTRANVLFISLVAQFNGEISNNVIEWFNNVNFISGLQDVGYGIYTIEKLKKDTNFNKWLSLIIRTLEISNITIEEIELKEEDINKIVKKTNDKSLANFFDALNKLKQGGTKKIKISTWHKKYDENNLLIDTIPFDFENQESEGTKKFINLLGPWYDTLKNGKVLIIDELDSRLHSHLTKKLIELFHKYNKKNAQLIFTSHDTSLLDKELFRRDQIWFTEKDQFGSSQIYSLADFKTDDVRNTSSYFKNYMNGKYGAISFFNIDSHLVELMYDEQS